MERKSEYRISKSETNSKDQNAKFKTIRFSRYWLRLVDTGSDAELEQERKDLEQEATELMKIFGSILRKVE